MSERTDPEPLGELAIVLHSHMPYVEGYGTYPFGEEWLFDAFLRSHLPVLEVARDLTLTVTPVLADQLESGGVAERLTGFCREHRLGAARLDLGDVPAGFRPAVEDEIERYGAALERLEALAEPLDAFRGAADRGVELIASAATHAVLPLLATSAGRALQIDAGLRSHHRRFGSASSGFWLPECAYEPGLEAPLAEHGIDWFVADQSAHEPDGAALTPVRSGALTAFTLDWPTVELAWSWGGYPSHRGYADFHRISGRGMRIFSIAGDPYEPGPARERAREQAVEFCAAVAARLRTHREQAGEPGLVVFAADTELFGHWWGEGPVWLEAVLEQAAAAGIRLTTLGAAAEAGGPRREHRLRRSSWGEHKDLSTWDSADVADLAWAARRMELRAVAEIASGSLPRSAAVRAARELMALQASDWAFLDKRRQAGEYAFERAAGHAGDLLAVLGGEPRKPRLRGLAPDLRLAPVTVPLP